MTYMFKKKGFIYYPNTLNEESLLEAALENGAEDFVLLDDVFQISTSKEQWTHLRDALENTFEPPVESVLAWVPDTALPVLEERKEKLIKLIQALEVNDDVQTVWHNAQDIESQAL